MGNKRRDAAPTPLISCAVCHILVDVHSRRVRVYLDGLNLKILQQGDCWKDANVRLFASDYSPAEWGVLLEASSAVLKVRRCFLLN